MTSETLLWLIPFPPLLAFGVIALFTHRKRALSHSLAIASATLSWLLAMVVFFRAVSQPHLSEEPFASTWNWLPLGGDWLKIGVLMDPVGAVTLFFVAWTILMIFIYSVGYHNFGQPEGDHDHPGLPPHGATVRDAHGHTHRVLSVEPMYSRFFALISLFAFAMFLLVLTDNLLTLYIGWEIMGFCSYMLIGFWYGKESARKAAIKAFLTTRVGDVFMLLGIVGVYTATGSLNYREALMNPTVLRVLAETPSGVLDLSVAGLLGLLLFIGTVGKSAQFPLHVWLPDAMEGPTPVSAMIHAATMVSAGVYLTVRIYPLLSAGWEGGVLTSAMSVVAFIGAFTALFAATIALAQNDIKRVLAYSTISQLGYMIAAVGIGAYVAAVFHLVTHAFFKALLFLGSGSVIHGMEHGVLHTDEKIDPQDMFNMGGLKAKMPVTFWTFLIGGLALSGFPVLTAGFWSKDEILTGAFAGQHWWVFGTLAVAAFLTAFYTMRQITLTFLGTPRTHAAEHAVESRAVMTAPLVVLSIFAVAFGWSGIPEKFPLLGGLIPNWFGEFVGSMLHGEGEHAVESLLPLLTSLVVSLGGLTLEWLVYRNVRAGEPDPLQKPLGALYRVFKYKYGIDELYDAVFVRPSVWLAEVFTYRFLDKMVLDGIIEGVARGTWNLGVALRRYFDLAVINWFGDAVVSGGTRKSGETLRPIQSGRVQQYLMVTLIGTILLGIVLYLMFVG
ncbi:NADH-quinone oxidoreductase subunit L [Anaerolinea sp.]|uniref:NADH-quinone oxidoreductase subunit L n=1 Tax=Anaerolinea sp. TaxID=1872519 RepID=UPI002ACEAF4C|nr:NADH-quinone oxidoreductase subunit L [Anaerolinea sp.]